jgi:hypothetical protein
MLNRNKSVKKDESWCIISVNGIKTKVQLRHLGRGKFRVVNDESQGNLIGNVFDASKIFHC